jgi:hypothetical protein
LAKLTDRQVELLSSVPGWAWFRTNRSWDESFNALAAHLAEHRALPTGQYDPLARWKRVQWRQHRTGRLTTEQIRRLESLPGWTWHGCPDRPA